MYALKTAILVISTAILCVHTGVAASAKCSPGTYQCGDDLWQDNSTIYTCNASGWWVKSSECSSFCCREADEGRAYSVCWAPSVSEMLEFCTLKRKNDVSLGSRGIKAGSIWLSLET